MGSVNGSTKRQKPAAPDPDPDRDPDPDPSSVRDPGPALGASGSMRVSQPIDLRARAAESSASRRKLAKAGASPSASATGPFGVGTAWSRLVDSLAGDVLLSHVPGRRVLDLGYGSPEVAEWVGERVGDHLSIVEKGALEQIPKKIAEESGFLPASEFLDADGNLLADEGEPMLRLSEYRDSTFDVVYCLRTFPHLGYDTETSERLCSQLLREAARVTADGGTIIVQIANPRSLRGLVEGIRHPITVVSRRRMILGDRYGLTRWDTLPRFLRFVPRELEFVAVHGLGVLIPHNATLQLPIVGSVLAKLEWRLRDMAIARHLGAHLLVELRRLHRSDPSLAEGGPERSSLSSSLIEAISAGGRKRDRDKQPKSDD